MNTNPPGAGELDRQARIDNWLTRDGVAESIAAGVDSTVAELYRHLVTELDGNTALVEYPAAAFTVTGWRFAARCAELAGEDLTAILYRCRALEAAGLSPDLEPGSSGYLLTIYPAHVEETAAGDVVAYCTTPLCRQAWRKANHDRRRLLEAHAEHVIREHSTTAGKIHGTDAF